MNKSNDYIIRKMFEKTLLIMILSTISATLGMLVDGIIIGNFLGVDAMAAYGMVSPAYLVMSFFGGVLSTGMQTICSECMGKGKMDEANGIFSLTCVLGFLASVLFAIVIVLLATPISMLLGTTGDTGYLLPQVRGYLIGIALGLPAMTITSCLQPVMQLDGDRGRAFISVLIMTAFNITGDLLNVFVFHGGMFGMAIATSLSYLVAVIVLVLHFFKKETSYRIHLKKIPWRNTMRVLATGLPSTAIRLYNTIRTLLLNKMLLTLAGGAAVAAFSVQSNMNNLFGSIGTGVSMSALMIFGIPIGEEDKNSTKKLLKVSLLEGFLLVTAVAVVLFAVAPFFVNLYISDDPQAALLAVRSVRFFAVSMPINNLIQVFASYLQSSRNLTLSHIVNVCNELILIVPCAFILGQFIGTDGVWASFPVTKILVLLLLFVIVAVRNKKIPLSMDDYLFLPENFDVSEEQKMEVSAQNMEQIITMSEEARKFCQKRGVDAKRGFYLSLCIEEMGGNIIRHGFLDGKKHSIDLRLIHKDDNMILRIRDNCKAFSPKKWMEIHQMDDPASNIGIRMTYAIAKDVNYIYVMDMNTLIIKI